MPLIPEETIVAVREATDIVALIGEYVRDLKAAGKNYKARCPFHDEKTPSFTVSAERQTYRCFGCGESGNAISFVMKMDQLSFPEAVQALGQRVGLSVSFEDNAPSRDPYYKVNSWACDWFHRTLKSESGQPSYQYLIKRGFTDETLEAFSLGAAPDSWDAFTEASERAGVPRQELIDVGLVVERDTGGVYDRFRARTMFPIFDARSRVVGFGGRLLEGEGAKYVNSPESPVFKKSQNLYGLHLAAKALRRDREAVIVEGYTDVIMAHQQGFDNVVAALGTAFNADHARLLKRYVDRVCLTLDGDAAGRKAAWQALPHLMSQGLEVRLCPLPEGMDPCDLLLQDVEGFRRCLQESRDPIDLAFDSLPENPGPDETSRVVKSLSELFSLIPDPVRRELHTRKLAEKSGVTFETLGQDVTRRVQTEQEAPSRLEKAERQPSTEGPAQHEFGLLAAFIRCPEKVNEFSKALGETDLLHPMIESLVKRVQEALANKPDLKSSHVEALFQDSQSLSLVGEALKFPSSDDSRLFSDCLNRLKKDKIRIFDRMARQARKDNDHETSKKYEKKRYLLTRDLKGNGTSKTKGAL